MGSPTTPDEFEQHQALDGSLDDDTAVAAEEDRPLTADELEQRQELGDDDREEFPPPDEGDDDDR